MPIDKQVFYISCCFNTFSLVLYGTEGARVLQIRFYTEKIIFFYIFEINFFVIQTGV